jgi:hypothetical protein
MLSNPMRFQTEEGARPEEAMGGEKDNGKAAPPLARDPPTGPAPGRVTDQRSAQAVDLIAKPDIPANGCHARRRRCQ